MRYLRLVQATYEKVPIEDYEDERLVVIFIDDMQLTKTKSRTCLDLRDGGRYSQHMKFNSWPLP